MKHIVRWVQNGMQEGEVSALTPAPIYSQTWQHGTPDLILTVKHPFNGCFRNRRLSQLRPALSA
jgi:hypothetical protein